MNYRTLGRTGVKVSVFGFGTGGGGDPLGQRSGMPEEEIHQLIRHAFDHGINFFDTAPGYMDSEIILGRALQPLPRNDVVISTKIALAGSMPGEATKVMAPADIEPAVDKSLRRLGVDYIDVLLIAVASPEFFETFHEKQLPVLERLKQKGKIRFLGSSEQSRDDGEHRWLQRILPTGCVDVVMVAHNIINQSARHKVFPDCVEKNVGAVNIYSVRNVFRNPVYMAQIISDFARRGLLSHEESDDFDLADWLVREEGVASLVEAAYRYAAFTVGVSTVMMGTLKKSRIEENIRYLERGPLSSFTIDRLHRLFGNVAEPVGN